MPSSDAKQPRFDAANVTMKALTKYVKKYCGILDWLGKYVNVLVLRLRVCGSR